MEPAEGCSFVAAAFDVVLDDTQREAFCSRETGYAIVEAPFHGLHAGEEVLDGPSPAMPPTSSLSLVHLDSTRVHLAQAPPAGLGVLCASSSDAELPAGVEPPAGLPPRAGC